MARKRWCGKAGAVLVRGFLEIRGDSDGGDEDWAGRCADGRLAEVGRWARGALRFHQAKFSSSSKFLLVPIGLSRSGEICRRCCRLFHERVPRPMVPRKTNRQARSSAALRPCRNGSLRIPTAHLFCDSDCRDRFPSSLPHTPTERNVSQRLTGWGMSLMTDIFQNNNG